MAVNEQTIEGREGDVVTPLFPNRGPAPAAMVAGPTFAVESERPPVDCRLQWSGRAVVISETTAIILAACFERMDEARKIKPGTIKGAQELMRAVDEVRLIVRDVEAAG